MQRSIEWPKPYDSPPAITAGKVFFTKNSGNRFVCSGTVVNSENKSLVWTAGHCVYPWPKRWTFCPGYDGDAVPACPYGKWPAEWLLTTPQWFKYYNGFAYDLGAAIVWPRSTAPKKLANYVGSQGIAWNLSPSQDFSAFGYPAGAPFDGTDLYECQDVTQGSFVYDFGPDGMWIYCDMTGGSSGGGWLIDVVGGLGYVNSVSSLGDNNPATYTAGPYQGSAAQKLYNRARY